eukprot:scaffold3529_cov68-Cylindrotheca_fusiformis.AAC.1
MARPVATPRQRLILVTKIDPRINCKWRRFSARLERCTFLHDFLFDQQQTSVNGKLLLHLEDVSFAIRDPDEWVMPKPLEHAADINDRSENGQFNRASKMQSQDPIYSHGYRPKRRDTLINQVNKPSYRLFESLLWRQRHFELKELGGNWQEQWDWLTMKVTLLVSPPLAHGFASISRETLLWLLLMLSLSNIIAANTPPFPLLPFIFFGPLPRVSDPSLEVVGLLVTHGFGKRIRRMSKWRSFFTFGGLLLCRRPSPAIAHF